MIVRFDAEAIIEMGGEERGPVLDEVESGVGCGEGEVEIS